ncbi:MAG: YhbY family RNA-binding protein [Euryarchaeota archaeon]|nr:YhbY family RNA-binding protein [Euryarchaeota archaeon]
MKESLLPPTLQIGHAGATDAVVAELKEQVRRNKVVKVKRLRTTDVEGGEKAFWTALAERARVRLLEVRGHSAVFADASYRTERDIKRERANRPRPPR